MSFDEKFMKYNRLGESAYKMMPANSSPEDLADLINTCDRLLFVSSITNYDEKKGTFNETYHRCMVFEKTNEEGKKELIIYPSNMKQDYDKIIGMIKGDMINPKPGLKIWTDMAWVGDNIVPIKDKSYLIMPSSSDVLINGLVEHFYKPPNYNDVECQEIIKKYNSSSVLYQGGIREIANEKYPYAIDYNQFSNNIKKAMKIKETDNILPTRLTH